MTPKVGFRGTAGNRETLDLTPFWCRISAQKRELLRNAALPATAYNKKDFTGELFDPQYLRR
jgi:hypothetical protein